MYSYLGEKYNVEATDQPSVVVPLGIIFGAELLGFWLLGAWEKRPRR